MVLKIFSRRSLIPHLYQIILKHKKAQNKVSELYQKEDTHNVDTCAKIDL